MVELIVSLQLGYLRTRSGLCAAMAKGALALHGWLHEIEHGNVSSVNDGVNDRTGLPTTIAWLENEMHV